MAGDRLTHTAMSPMNPVRIAISLFIVVLIGVATRGWIWTGGHQPPAQATASRVVLTLCIVAGLVGLGALWLRRPTK